MKRAFVLFILSFCSLAMAEFTCEDYNLTRKKMGWTDRVVNVSDVTVMINYLSFYSFPCAGCYHGVLPTSPLYDPDYNFDTSSSGINIADLTALINWIDANKLSPDVFMVVCE